MSNKEQDELLCQTPQSLVLILARHARRLQPVFNSRYLHADGQKHRKAIEEAIRAAEEFAKSAVDKLAAGRVAYDALEGARRVRDAANREDTGLAARAAFMAVRATVYAVQGPPVTVKDIAAEVLQDDLPIEADFVAELNAAAMSDAKLLKENPEACLGPLWPAETPQWYKEALESAPPAHEN